MISSIVESPQNSGEAERPVERKGEALVEGEDIYI